MPIVVVENISIRPVPTPAKAGNCQHLRDHVGYTRTKGSKRSVRCVAAMSQYALAIHGGAGVINSSDAEALELAKEGLKQALLAGQAVLKDGGSSLDAVTAAVVSMEDNPCFNAGKGSVRTRDGHFELEATIMTSDMRCGGATLLKRVKNPIRLARKVMEETPHILLSGEHAEAFAESQGLELVEQDYFATAARLQQWERYKQNQLAESAKMLAQVPKQDEIIQKPEGFGTVGAVAVDRCGKLAAATSTGGRTNKWDGRIGDSANIGQGTYANKQVAISGTGYGEQFQRYCVSHEVAALMRYKGLSLTEATKDVVHGTLEQGDGGVIAVDSDYNMSMEFNSKGMYRGFCDSTGRFEVAVFQEGLRE